MRITIDLPEHLHANLRRIALEQHRSISAVTVDLIRAGIERPPQQTRPADYIISPITGLLTISIGHPVTPEDVKSLEDED